MFRRKWFIARSLLFTRELPIVFAFGYRLGLTCNASPSGVVATLDPANADHLAHLTPEADRWAVEGLLVSIDGGTLPNQIDLVGRSELGALQKLPTEESDESCEDKLVACPTKLAGDYKLTKDKHGVVDEEVLHTPRPERGVSVEEDDEDHPSKSNVCLIYCQSVDSSVWGSRKLLTLYGWNQPVYENAFLSTPWALQAR
jgi:hypothetical protein